MPALTVAASGALAHGDEDHSQDGKKTSSATPSSGALAALQPVKRKFLNSTNH